MARNKNERCPGGCGEKQQCICYVQGLSDAHFALRMWRPGLHTEDCECDQCRAGKAVLYALRGARGQN